MRTRAAKVARRAAIFLVVASIAMAALWYLGHAVRQRVARGEWAAREAEGEGAYRSLLQRKPSDAGAWRQLATIQWDKKEYSASVASATRAITLAPEDYYGWTVFGLSSEGLMGSDPRDENARKSVVRAAHELYRIAGMLRDRIETDDAMQALMGSGHFASAAGDDVLAQKARGEAVELAQQLAGSKDDAVSKRGEAYLRSLRDAWPILPVPSRG